MDVMVVGIDVSKDRLDVAVRPTGEGFAFKRTAAGIDDLVTRLKNLVAGIGSNRSHWRLRDSGGRGPG